MNIYAEHQNLSPKENFNHLKNHDIVLNKIKSNSSNNQNESRLSKEIPMKNNILKHEFKTPAIVHSHKLPKAFNNAMNPKFSNEQYENIKLPENKYFFTKKTNIISILLIMVSVSKRKN